MNIEDSIFKKYIPDYEKLIKFGFEYSDKNFRYEKNFMRGEFRAVVDIDKKGNIDGKVFDNENGEEYVPLKIAEQEGAFVGEARAAYENILLEIRNSCFMKLYFSLPQANRITKLIIDTYGNEPEFLWEKYDGSGIFRNQTSNKWYAAILEVDRSKLQPGKKGPTEVINLKLEKEHVQQIIKKQNYYPAYHMNKKYWISIILDDSVDDKNIMTLVAESRKLSSQTRGNKT